MRALVYGEHGGLACRVPREDVPAALAARIAAQPVSLQSLDEPTVTDPHGVVVAPRLAGVCGTDARLLLGDFCDDDIDNPMAAFSVLPFIPGHEVVADVVATGSAVAASIGDRVVVDPWLSCAPRGFAACASCARGELSMCERFLDGPIGPGLHLGVTAGAPGGFAQLLGVHDSQLHAVPDGVSDRAAVLADPFSVSLHSIVRTPPPKGGRALVIGAGALGTTAVAILRRWHPDVAVAVMTRFDHQADAVLSLGAQLAFDHETRDAALDAVAAWSKATLRPALDGLAMSYPGGVDVVYDTVATASTIELAVRATRTRGSVVILGVATPRRFEWTPIYFKELHVVGSSGFGVESVDGVSRHAIDHYLAACRDGLDLSWMVTHTDVLEGWQDLCGALGEPGRSGVLKAAFTPNP